MHRQDARPGLRERLHVALGFVDHQVGIEREGARSADGGHHTRPEGDVGHEAPVHNIQMEVIRAGRLGSACLFAKTREIR